MLFGEFLFLKCVVDEETLLHALGEQIRARPLLGEVAVSEGYLSAWDVYRVLNEQAKSHRYFGEIAIELGLISRDELERMLQLQRDGTPPIGEILVRRGVFTAEALQELLVEFHELNARHGREQAARRSA